MSRKTIVFNMPAQDAGRANEPLEGEIAAPGEPDRWVRESQIEQPSSAGAPASAFFAASGAPASGLPFDLAAERNLSQVVALSLALPSALGWFWCANAFERYRRLFA